jgi:hypothetical protein
MPRLLATSFLALAALATAHAAAGPAGRAPLSTRAPARCTPAAIADVRLPTPVPVDEIRVIVADGSPLSGAAQVTVDAGDFDRVLHVRGASHGLTFYPALTSAEFRVSLAPVFTAGAVCIERIELRRAGAPVATVVP